MTLTPQTLPGKYFSAGTMAGQVLEPFTGDNGLTWFCDQLFADGRPSIPRLLGVNLLRTARFYDCEEDARRAGWSVEVWDRGETVEL